MYGIHQFPGPSELRHSTCSGIRKAILRLPSTSASLPLPLPPGPPIPGRSYGAEPWQGTAGQGRAHVEREGRGHGGCCRKRKRRKEKHRLENPAPRYLSWNWDTMSAGRRCCVCIVQCSAVHYLGTWTVFTILLFARQYGVFTGTFLQCLGLLP